MSIRRDARAISVDERALFRDAVRDARPIKLQPRASTKVQPPPVPVQSLLDAHDTLKESVSGEPDPDLLMETGEELVFLRPGMTREVLRRLRRGHWVVQDQLDLHGMNSEQARNLLAQFLSSGVKRGIRCIRIVHGKGLRSPQREPILKKKVRNWLAQREEVLAFCQAPAHHGGSGAVVVLLKG